MTYSESWLVSGWSCCWHGWWPCSGSTLGWSCPPAWHSQPCHGCAKFFLAGIWLQGRLAPFPAPNRICINPFTVFEELRGISQCFRHTQVGCNPWKPISHNLVKDLVCTKAMEHSKFSRHTWGYDNLNRQAMGFRGSLFSDNLKWPWQAVYRCSVKNYVALTIYTAFITVRIIQVSVINGFLE